MCVLGGCQAALGALGAALVRNVVFRVAVGTLMVLSTSTDYAECVKKSKVFLTTTKLVSKNRSRLCAVEYREIVDDLNGCFNVALASISFGAGTAVKFGKQFKEDAALLLKVERTEANLKKFEAGVAAKEATTMIFQMLTSNENTGMRQAATQQPNREASSSTSPLYWSNQLELATQEIFDASVGTSASWEASRSALYDAHAAVAADNAAQFTLRANQLSLLDTLRDAGNSVGIASNANSASAAQRDAFVAKLGQNVPSLAPGITLPTVANPWLSFFARTVLCCCLRNVTKDLVF